CRCMRPCPDLLQQMEDSLLTVAWCALPRTQTQSARIHWASMGSLLAGQCEDTMTVQKKIKVAIAGVGNCASALVQGVEYYRDRQGAALEGIMCHSIGGYTCGDIEFVAAFDVDGRKVGHPLEQAIFAKPNCTHIFQSVLPVSNVIVQMG